MTPLDVLTPSYPPSPQGSAGAPGAAPELSIVVPTYNERQNVPLLVERLKGALGDIAWEVIFVDDNSPDGTAEVIHAIAQEDRRVRCIRRVGRRGLSGACVEGMLASEAPLVAVIDADLQHDETLLVRMIERMRKSDVDLVVASRYAEGGSAASFATGRARLSQWATRLSRRLLRITLTDPMSGFFMIRRAIVEEMSPALSTQGFKLLLDIVATARGKLRVAEIPYVFGERLHGESKFDVRNALDFAALLVAKLSNDTVSIRFLMFCLVGLSGVGVHMTILRTGLLAAIPFIGAQTLATIGAMTSNFTLNNAVTYHDQRLHGWSFVTGLIRFQIICGIGALSNIGVASWIYGHQTGWFFAGLGGVLIGTMWNYAVTALFVWQRR